MPARIRRIRTDEGARFRDIRLRALRDTPRAFGSTAAEAEKLPPGYWAQRAWGGAEGRESVILVAEDGDAWVGLVGGFLDEDGDGAQLISMWVHPAYRSQGLGRDLVLDLIAWAVSHGVGAVRLGVTADNDAAIGLYARCGFVSTGRENPHPSQPDAREIEMVYRVP